VPPPVRRQIDRSGRAAWLQRALLAPRFDVGSGSNPAKVETSEKALLAKIVAKLP
jgi:hypothetical protein